MIITSDVDAVETRLFNLLEADITEKENVESIRSDILIYSET